MSNAVRESSDTSDDLSDTALKSETGDVTLLNGIPAAGIDRTDDVSS